MKYSIIAVKCWAPAEGLTKEEADIVLSTLEAEEIQKDFQTDGLTTFEIVAEEL